MASIINLAADVAQEINSSPFSYPKSAVEIASDAGGNLYSTNGPGRDAYGGNYQRFTGNAAGTKVAWTVAELVNLAGAHIDGGTLDTADVLKVIVAVTDRNSGTRTLLTRVAASASPGAGEFKTSGTPGSEVLTLGTAPQPGQEVELLLSDDIRTLTLGAGGRIEAAANRYAIADAAFTLVRLAE